MFEDTSIITLYQEAQRLDNSALDNLIAQLQSIRTLRKTSDKQKEESFLLKKINRSLNSTQMLHFQALNEKRLNSKIDTIEMEDLHQLLQTIEKLHAERIKYLGQLAVLRNMSVRDLLIKLNLSPILHG
jgi:hypothetical protein